MGPDPRHTQGKGTEDRLAPESGQGQGPAARAPAATPEAGAKSPTLAREQRPPRMPRRLHVTPSGDKVWERKTQRYEKGKQPFQEKYNNVQGTGFKKDRTEILDGILGSGMAGRPRKMSRSLRAV